eukprot:TRINITY_DN33379_c0_g1_i1.p1 TRINITY_DN33379_c0_g1~~TRINITY_DN33379_c0_g1_i1.p1  ORF type:complete len:163 (+),score=12.85 TRINITY_DN33379_c0_g1_i1:81-569(+)
MKFPCLPRAVFGCCWNPVAPARMELASQLPARVDIEPVELNDDDDDDLRDAIRLSLVEASAASTDANPHQNVLPNVASGSVVQLAPSGVETLEQTACLPLSVVFVASSCCYDAVRRRLLVEDYEKLMALDEQTGSMLCACDLPATPHDDFMNSVTCRRTGSA